MKLAGIVCCVLAACGKKTEAPHTGPGSVPVASAGEPLMLGAPVIHRSPRPGIIRRPSEPDETVPAHEPAITSIAVDDAGTTVLTLDEPPSTGWPDHSEPGVFVWDRAQSKLLGKLGAQAGRMVVMSGDGKLAATADLDGHLRIWDLAQRRENQAIALPDPIAVGFTPDGKRILGVGRHAIGVFDTLTGAALETHAVDTLYAAIAPAGDRVAIGTPTGAALWAIGNAHPVPITTGAKTVAVAFSADGATLGLGDEQGSAHLFNLATAKQTRAISVAMGWPVRSIAVVSRDTMIVGTNDRLALYAGDRPAKQLASGERFDALAVFARGSLLAAGAFSGTVRFWNLKEARELRGAPSYTGEIQALAFGPNELLSNGVWPGDEQVQSWDLSTHKPTAVKHAGAVVRAIAPDASRIVYQRDLDDPKLVVVGHGGAPRPAADNPILDVSARGCSRNGRWLALGGQDGMLALFDLSSDSVTTWRANHELIQAIGIADDGRRIATGTDTIRIWDPGKPAAPVAQLGGGKLLNTLYLGFFDDKHLVSATQSDGIQVWDLETKTAKQIFEGDGHRPQGTADLVMTAVLAPEHALLVTGHASGALRTWDLLTGKPVASQARHAAPITALAITADGQRVASGDRDGVIWISPIAALTRAL